MNEIVLNHPLITHKLGILRSVTTGTKEFRELIKEIAMILCYEAMKDVELVETEITTITLPDGVNICSFNPADEEYSGRIAEISKDGDIDGDYFAKVIKIFNGTTAESIIEEDQYFTIKF